jgi:hypothetical protein
VELAAKPAPNSSNIRINDLLRLQPSGDANSDELAWQTRGPEVPVSLSCELAKWLIANSPIIGQFRAHAKGGAVSSCTRINDGRQ